MLRKDAKLTIDDRVVLRWKSDDVEVINVFTRYADDIMARVNATEIVEGIDGAKHTMRIETDGGGVDIGI
jgi:hypothetical protein